MQIFRLIRHPHLSLTVLTQARRAAERNETQPDRHSVIGLRRIDSTVPPRAYLNLTPFTLKASGPELCNTSNAILPNPAQEHGSAISVIALLILLMCYEVIMYCLAIRCVLERANKNMILCNMWTALFKSLSVNSWNHLPQHCFS